MYSDVCFIFVVWWLLLDTHLYMHSWWGCVALSLIYNYKWKCQRQCSARGPGQVKFFRWGCVRLFYSCFTALGAERDAFDSKTIQNGLRMVTKNINMEPKRRQSEPRRPTERVQTSIHLGIYILWKVASMLNQNQSKMVLKIHRTIDRRKS